MYKILTAILLVLALATTAFGEFTESDYSTMSDSIQRLQAASEVMAEFKGFFQDWESRKVRILSYRDKLGTGDAVILQNYIDTATALYNQINNGLANIESNTADGYRQFLTGDDGVE